jgi:transcription elongation factor Elf1
MFNPNSRRYCLNCNSEQTFKYDPHICHSACLGCGLSSRISFKNGKNAIKVYNKIKTRFPNWYKNIDTTDRI